MKCLNCDKEVVSTGNRKRQFCSDKCRMAFKRQKQSKTNAPESPTINEPEPIRTEVPSKANIIESEQSLTEQRYINLKPCPAGMSQSQWNYICSKRVQV